MKIEELVKEIAHELWQWDNGEMSQSNEYYEQNARYLIDRIKKEIEK